MGLQTKGQRSPQQNRCERFRRRGTRPRHSLCLNPNFRDKTNPFDDRLDEAVDRESGRHVSCFLARPCGKRQLLYVVATRHVPERVLHNNNLEAQKGTIRPSQQPQSMSRFLRRHATPITISQGWSANQMPTQTKSDVFVLVYVDNFLFLGEPQQVDAILPSSKQYNNLFYCGTQAHSELERQSISSAGKSQTMVIITKSRWGHNAPRNFSKKAGWTRATP